MLNNSKYFNQSIITSSSVQNRLLQFFEGLDIQMIVELINKDIEQKHLNDETFVGNIKTQNCQIYYERDFKHWNAVYVCPEWAKMKNSVIVITKDDIILTLAGDNYRFQAKREMPNQELMLDVYLNKKTKIMDIKEERKVSEQLKRIRKR